MSTNTRSLLRYPGSKARFSKFITAALRLNGVRDALFVEPFCGGASVSIALLEAKTVGRIALNDSDPLIAALWDTVFSPRWAEWLAKRVMDVPLTLDEWKRQKEANPSSAPEMALKCLYLNRTSFNGIIHKAGPIGGWGQEKRTLGVRFNRERLATRIVELSRLHDKVEKIGNSSWEVFSNEFRGNAKAFFYFDPPYYHKAEQLYGHYFQHEDHCVLKDYLEELGTNWMLSYDDAPEVRKLYGELGVKARVIDSTYSAHPIGGSSFVGRELFYSNLSRLPAADDKDVEHIGLTVRKYLVSKADSSGPVRIPCTESTLSLVTA